MPGNFMFLGWLLIWLLLHPVRAMTTSMEAMTTSMENLAMIFSMVREEMIVRICAERLMIFESLISRALLFQTFLAEAGRTVSGHTS